MLLADAASVFFAHQVAALARVQSMRIRFKNARVEGEAMNVRSPHAVLLFLREGRTVTEMRSVGGKLYVRQDDGKWNVSPEERGTQTMIDDRILPPRNARVTILQDRVEDGIVVGFERVVSGSRDMVCSYDKHTLLMRACGGAGSVLEFSHYNDPSNRVEVPAGIPLR